MFKQRLPAMARSFVPLAVAITLLAGLIYMTGQQLLRQGADDPQIEMAHDAAASLAAGQALQPAPQVDIATSLAPYLIVFDAQGQPVDGSARLHGKLPDVPQGALLAAKGKGENKVTWQPERGVRSATVIVPVSGGSGGYVLAGRSLAAVEARTDNIKSLVLAGWLVALAGTLLVVILVNLV